jgi:hypothetical protein
MVVRPSGPELEEHLDVPAGDAGRLRVAFEHVGDRFRHVIGLSSAGEFRPLIASVEGDASQAWPPSPPLQQLHVESRGEQGDVALLVGMAGRSHWSLSVEPCGGPIGDAVGFIFDVACRSPEVPQFLGSRYVALKGAWRLEGTDCAVLESPHAVGRLVIETLPQDQPDAGSVGYAMEIDAAELSLALSTPPEAETGKRSATTARWRYRIHWQSAG